MSQASRSKVTAAVRRREQLARVLVVHASPFAPGLDEDLDERVEELLGGDAWLDVYRARDHARSLIRGDADNDHARQRCDLGLRLLDALEGQPSECQGPCIGRGTYFLKNTHAPEFAGVFSTCPNCHGSGHNKRGYLPAIEWSPQVKRKVSDSFEGELGDDERCKIPQWVEGLGISIFAHAGPTRVVPRGEHRLGIALTSCLLAWAPSSVILADGFSDNEYVWSRAPRWRRGELRHAEQRRKRDHRMYMAEMAEHALTASDVL